MKIVEHSFSKREGAALRKAFRGCDTFVCSDPDANGAMAVYSRGDMVAVKSLSDPTFFAWMELSVRERFFGAGRIVAVIETQFVSANRNSTVTMARRAGYIAGALAMCSRTGVEVINVVPASWQYPTAQAIGMAGKLSSEQLKKAAMSANKALCESVHGWFGHTAAQQQGIADTLGIGQWWRNLCAGVW